MRERTLPNEIPCSFLADKLDGNGALLALLHLRHLQRSLHLEVALVVQLTLELVGLDVLRNGKVLDVLAVDVVAILALLLTLATDLQRVLVHFDGDLRRLEVMQVQRHLILVVLDRGHGQLSSTEQLRGSAGHLRKSARHQVVQWIDEEVVVVQSVHQRTGETRQRKHLDLLDLKKELMREKRRS